MPLQLPEPLATIVAWVVSIGIIILIPTILFFTIYIFYKLLKDI